MLKCEKSKQATWNSKIEWSERRLLFLEKRGLEGVRGGEKVILYGWLSFEVHKVVPGKKHA